VPASDAKPAPNSRKIPKAVIPRGNRVIEALDEERLIPPPYP
jgi:hypothetical protein